MNKLIQTTSNNN